MAKSAEEEGVIQLKAPEHPQKMLNGLCGEIILSTVLREQIKLMINSL